MVVGLRKLVFCLAFVLLFGSAALLAKRVPDLPSSQNGTQQPIECPSSLANPFLVQLDGTQQPPAGCTPDSDPNQPNPPATYPNRKVVLSDAAHSLAITIVPVLWEDGSNCAAPSGCNKKTIFEVEFAGREAGMTLRSLVIGTALNHPTYVVCDPNDPNFSSTYCTSVATTQLEALQPAAVTLADTRTTRWDFVHFQAGSKLNVVFDGFPSEFETIDKYPNSNPLTQDILTPSNFLAIVQDPTGHTFTAGGLDLGPAAPPAPNDLSTQPIAIPRLPYQASVDTSLTNPTENSTDGSQVNPQGDPANPCVLGGSRVFRSVWYTLTGTGGPVTLSTLGSRYDTVISVFTGSTAVACNDDDAAPSAAGAVESTLTFNTAAGITYSVMVSEAPPDVLNLTAGGTAAIPLSNDATLTLSAFGAGVDEPLTVGVNGNGTVTSADGFINCPAACSHLYPTSTPVTLNATPASGWVFSGWSGACSGIGTCTVTMTHAQSVVATFSQPTFNLSVSNTGNGTVTSADGSISCGLVCSAEYNPGTPVTLTATAAQGSIFFGWTGCDTTRGNSCTVTMNGNRTVGATFSQNAIGGLQFVPLTPCRVADTRGPDGTFGGPFLFPGSPRDFPIPQSACNIPANAAAYSLNITAVPHQPLGFLSVWASGQPQPLVSTLNSFDGRTKANAAIVVAGTSGAVSVFASNITDLVLDINGYFVSGDSSALAFYTLPPCRVLDTRAATGPLGGPSLVENQARPFPVPTSGCNVPAGAQAYSLNVTAIPHGPLFFLTMWPSGQPWPGSSTLNAPTGTAVANGAIVPAGPDGAIQALASNDTDLVVDINGYFAPAGTGGLSLYPTTACRVLDTRSQQGNFKGELTVNVVGRSCNVPSAAEAFVLNATVVPPGPLGFLSLWPDGQTQPVVSTLNSFDGAVTSNMAIVPTSIGEIDAYASDLTPLILDISSYFAP